MEGLVDMPIWTGRSVLITGATGLVGSWLTKRLLSEGAHVTALILDNDYQSELIRSGKINSVNIVNGNLCNLDDVKRAVYRENVEMIFHLGAQTIVGNALLDPLTTLETNVQGTWNVLETARLSKGLVKSILIASSDKAYGTSPSLPYTEHMPLRGDGPYDVSKSATDLISRSYGLTYELPVVIARCGNIYGGGDLNWSRIIPGTIKSLLLGEVPVIRSDGKYVRDYIHVDDAVDAYLHMAKSVSESNIYGEAFNFSRDEPMSVLDLYSKICEVVLGEYIEPLIRNSARAEIHSQHLDNTKAREQLGWISKISIEDGLARTVEWYRKFLNS